MILGQAEANKVLPLITNLEAYEAFQELLKVLHADAYYRLKEDVLFPPKEEAIGQLKLLDDLKQLRERLRDAFKNDTGLNKPLNF